MNRTPYPSASVMLFLAALAAMAGIDLSSWVAVVQVMNDCNSNAPLRSVLCQRDRYSAGGAAGCGR